MPEKTPIPINLEARVRELERIIKFHKHYGSDKSQKLDGNIELKEDKRMSVGRMYLGNSNINVGLANEINRLRAAAGIGSDPGYAHKSINSELILEHQKATALSFFYGFRPPLYTGPEAGDTIGVTNGGNTITDGKKTFTTNALAGAYISILGAGSGTLETHLIASNTATVITIATTWVITENVGYTVFVPMYLGAANYPWQRVYLMGDLRFGSGASAGANVIYIKYGAGDPENVVTANIGSLYLRTDGGANTTLYVKESGTGNTGWIAK